MKSKLLKSKLPLKLWALLFAMFFCGNAFAQKISVKGQVVDAAGESIIGATVRVLGTTAGTITDLDGNFMLDADLKDSLAVSYIGYSEVVVKAAENLHIVLQEDTKEMDEVVVIGYGKVKKNDLTGSVTAISADKMVRGAATSATDLLAGKAAGVSVISDGGAPGAGATIRIRGGSSMSASNNPLVVIDGVAVDDGGIDGMSNPLATVHPNDIETFTILKDASATAIYGSRASNGVIIITTKKGKSGKPKVSYAGTVSVSTKRNDIDIMDANEFKSFVTEKFGADSEKAQALGNSNTDWWNEIFRTSVSTDHNISVSGTVKNLPYRVSVGYTNENGILKNSKMERLTGAISLTPTFFDKKLSVSVNVKGISNKNRFGATNAIGMASQFDPTQPVKMSGNQYGNGWFVYMKEDGSAPIDIALTNPVSILEEQDDKSTVLRSIGNIQADYKFHFLPDLRFNVNLGYDVSKSDGEKTITDNSPMTWSSGDFKTGFGENTDYYQNKTNGLFESYFDYDKTFGIHSLDVMVGYSWQHFYSDKGTKYPYSSAKAKETGKEFYKDEYSYETENYLVSFFGRLNYTLLERYLLTFTLRDDGSSRFHKDNRWGVFPSAAFAWKINDEAFLENSDIVSDLKLRLGYGVTGQQNLTVDGPNDYPYMARYKYSEAGASYYFGDTQYRLIAPQAYDQNLKWEETTTLNAGLDFGFLKGRFEGSLDFYIRKTTNLLNSVTVSAGTNFSNQLLTNVGELENRGVEFSLTAHVINKKDLEWTLSYNVSYNKNEITKLTINDDPSYKGVIHGGIEGGTGHNIQINAVDKPYNSFYVYEQMYDEAGNPIEDAYVDQNNDGKIDEDDLTIFKKSAPDVIMGLSSQLSYKNWFFNFAMRAAIGNYVYNNVKSNREAWDGSQMYDPSGFLKNRMSTAGETNFKNGQYKSSYYIENASFLRMDNMTLGYNFQKIFNTSQNAKVYFTVQNPFVITKYSGLDPEISGEGIDRNIYPRPVTFMFGVNLNF